MAIQRVVFLGSKRLGLGCLETMHRLSPETLAGVVTIDDRDDARTALDDFVAFCAARQLPFRIAKDRRHSEDIIREFKPELCFVAGWYWLFGKDILDSVPNGFLGIHFSLLPKYRGSSPLVWALMNGETETGLSLFSIVEGMDAGAIWAQESVPIGSDDYVGDVLACLEKRSINTLHSKYPGILNKTLRSWKQNQDEATYCSWRQPSDGEIYWRASAGEIYNFIRAQSRPYPGAFTRLQEKKLIIWRARRESALHYGTPGQVAKIAGDGVHVICGDHRAIVIESVGWEGVTLNAHQALKSVSIRLPSGVV